MYKMVPVTPETYANLERMRDEMSLASFDELLRPWVAPKDKPSFFGCWKGKAWAREFKRDRVDRF